MIDAAPFKPPFRDGLEGQLNQLRKRWPQAHFEPKPDQTVYAPFLIIVPSVLLPSGWDKTICTVLFHASLMQDGRHQQSPLDGFYVDLELRLANKMWGQYSRSWAPTGSKIPWHEDAYRREAEIISPTGQWRGMTRFWWRSQAHSPLTHTLFTTMMMIRNRLDPAR